MRNQGLGANVLDGIASGPSLLTEERNARVCTNLCRSTAPSASVCSHLYPRESEMSLP